MLMHRSHTPLSTIGETLAVLGLGIARRFG